MLHLSIARAIASVIRKAANGMDLNEQMFGADKQISGRGQSD